MFGNICTHGVHLRFALHVAEGVATMREQCLFNRLPIVATIATLAAGAT
jgi:hypothetical protein